MRSPAKRASLTPKEREDMRSRQGNLCGCGCERPLLKRCIAEHIWTVALGNAAKPDALFREDCAAEKTRTDRALIAKVDRQSLATGQQARRARRKEQGREPLMRGRGFDKSMTRKMSGVVERNNGKRISSVRRDRRGLAQEAGAEA